MRSLSRFPFRRQIQVCPHKHLPFSRFTIHLRLAERHIPTLLLKLFRLMLPIFSRLEKVAQVLFCSFWQLLLFFAKFDDLFGFFESFSHDLVQCLLVDLRFRGQFLVVKRNSLVQNTRDLLKQFAKVLFELWGQLLEQGLNRSANFLPVDAVHVLIDFLWDQFHCPF